MVVMETGKPTATMALGSRADSTGHRSWGGEQAPQGPTRGEGAQDAARLVQESGSRDQGPPPGSECHEVN